MALTTLAGFLALLGNTRQTLGGCGSGTVVIGNSLQRGTTAGTWSPGTPGTAGRVPDNTDDRCVVVPTVGGSDRAYLVDASAWTPSSVQNRNRQLLLADVAWCNSGLSVAVTTAQTWTPVALPARAGSGRGFEIALLTTAGNSATLVTDATVSYTNSAGTAGRTATCAAASRTAGVAGRTGGIHLFALEAGDVGVQSIDGFQWGTLPSGTAYSLLLMRRLLLVGSRLERSSRAHPLHALRDVTSCCVVPFWLTGPDGSSAPVSVCAVSVGVG